MLGKLIKPRQLLTGKARAAPGGLDSSEVNKSEERHKFPK